MKHVVAFICLLLAASAAPGAEIVLKTPLDYQVVQRSTPGKGLVQIVGDLSEECPPAATIEARFVAGDEEPAWRSVGGSVKDRRLTAAAALPAGGWWRLDVRVMHAGRESRFRSTNPARHRCPASWLLNAAYADDWQTFQRDGQVASPR